MLCVKFHIPNIVYNYNNCNRCVPQCELYMTVYIYIYMHIIIANVQGAVVAKIQKEGKLVNGNIIIIVVYNYMHN